MSTARIRTRLLWTMAIAIGLLVLVIGFAWYFKSERFRSYVQARVVDEIEKSTGGRVELKDLRWNLSKLEIDVHDLTVHGLEGADEVPYAHIDHLNARLKIFSVLRREVGLRYLLIERPTIHIIVYPDGTTNQPTPKLKRTRGRTPIEQVFDLAIERVEIREGLFIANERRIPLDVSGNDIAFGMTYDLLAKRYDGSLHAGKIDTHIKEFRPFAVGADVQFSLFSDYAELKSVRMASGNSNLEGSGRIEDFRSFRVSLNYEGSVDLKQLASILRQRQLRDGALRLEGNATYAHNAFQSSGKSSVRGLEFQNDSIRFGNVSATADYDVTQDRLTLSRVRGRALDANMSGEAEIRDWTSAAKQNGTATFRVSQLPASRLFEAIRTSKVPLERLNGVGNVSGDAKLNWRGVPFNPDVTATLEVVAPQQPAPDQVPLNGTVRGTFRGRSQTFEIAALVLETRNSSITASGTLGSSRANMKVAFNASDLTEFRPLIDSMRGPTPLPVDIGGRASFVGTLSGPFRNPEAKGLIEIADFNTIITLPADQQEPEQARSIHWDSVTSNLQYSPRGVSFDNLVLRRGSSEIRGDGSLGLTRGEFTDNSPLQVQVNVSQADAADLLSLFGYPYPIAGTLNANFALGGTRANPMGNGRLSLTNATAYGENIKSLTANIELANKQANIRDINLVGTDAKISGNATYTIPTKRYSFDLRGDNVLIANLEFLKLRKLALGGAVDFRARGSGTIDQPTLNAELNAVGLKYQNQQLGDLRAEAATRGDQMLITARSSFENAAVSLDGTVHLRKPFTSELRLSFSEMDLRAYLPTRIGGRVIVAGNLNAKGPLANPRAMRVQGNLDKVAAEVENVRITNSGPVGFLITDQVLNLEQLHLVGDGTDFTAQGSAELRRGGKLALRANGAVNLKLVHSFSPDLIASGMTNVSLTIGGTTDQPAVLGQIQVNDGAMSYVDLPNGLSNINGTLVFSENRLQVQQLTARTGGGQLKIGGFINYGRTLSFNLTASGKDIRLRYPPGISSTANAELTLSGTLKNSLLSGDITVTRFGLNQEFDFGAYAAKARGPATVPDPNSPLSNLRVDVHVISTPELNVQTSLARVSGNVDLRVRGTAARPSVLGRIGIVRGEVLFNGTKYNVERGEITFTNAVKIEPVLDLEASARVRDYEINLGFHGPVDELRTTYRSDPPLPTGDIIALLALGRTREETAGSGLPGQTQTTFTESASNAILGQALNATVSNRAQKLFGISRIKIDPQVGGPENNPNARLTIEQQVANNITLTYITNLAQSAQQVIQVEYNVNRDVSIIAVRDENGVVGFDVRIRKRKR
jgi:translocation and assembly module TamB